MKIGYARVSTDDQNPDLQRQALLKAGCTVICEDRGISGARADRPGLAKALCRIRPGDMLVVWSVDRLGRSLRHLVDVLDGIGQAGADFQSLCEPIDTSTPGGRLMFHVMAAMAEFERAINSERTRAGMKSAQRRGIRLGRPFKLSADDIAMACALIADGATRHGIALQLGVDVTTLRRALKRTR